MTIELTLLISVLAFAFSVFFGLKNNRRADDDNVKKAASNDTAMMVKLETIGANVVEIKSEIGSVKRDLKEVNEKVIIADQIARSAQKRLEEHIGKSCGSERSQ